jgi:O-antigen/teichoic acid export membrane protein
LAEQVDRFILAKLISFKMLGVYTIAFTLATLPREVLKNLCYRVLFPIIARSVEIPRAELRQQILQHRGMLLLGTAGVLAMIVVFGDLIVTRLYRAEYEAATWMLPILALGVWFSALFYTVCQTLIAIGKPIYYAYSNLARFIFVTVGLYVGYHHWGVLGAVVAVSLTDFWAYVVVLYGLAKERLLCLRQDLWSTGLFIGLTLVLGLGRQALGFGFPLQNLLLP